MKNYIIPTTVVDDFFDDPYLVTEFAKSQSYKKDEFNQWRAKELNQYIN